VAAPDASTPLKRTPLYDLHLQAQARMTGFGGWDMPVQYAGITAEHQAVRQAAGMFDISHMGKFYLRGPSLVQQFQTLVPSDLSVVKPGQAKYTVFLNPKGGILDDLIFYNQGEDASGQPHAMVIVNAATKDKDKDWIVQHLDLTKLEFQDLSEQQVLIAVQGPKATAILQTLVDIDLTNLKNYGHQSGQVLGQPAWFARTGYTGEDGFEVMVAPEVGRQLWLKLQNLGVSLCGLGARDTLRLEAAMALYGQDIDDSRTPLEAGLGWLISWDKGEFIGAEALQQQKAAGDYPQLVGLEMQGRNIARHDYPIVLQNQAVGKVTSGTLSPTLGKAIALAYVPAKLAQLGQELGVEIRGKVYPGTVVARPFYRRAKS
jgi:aminomethyltransferase